MNDSVCVSQILLNHDDDCLFVAVMFVAVLPHEQACHVPARKSLLLL